MEPSAYQALLRHMEWADALIWEAVLEVKALEDDVETRERLHHFHATQRAYLQLWRGQPLLLPELSAFPDLRPLCEWAHGCYVELAGFAASLDGPALERTIELPWAEHLARHFGSMEPATLGETILQVVHHTTHHRGQVATQLRASGGKPPLVDFIAWVWMRKPSPRWPDFGVESQGIGTPHRTSP